MKRYIVTALSTILLISSTSSLSPKAHAASISVGPYFWYAWWKPFFKDQFIGKEKTDEMDLYTLRAKFSMNPVPLYGGILSINFTNRINFSNVFSFGCYRVKAYKVTYNGTGLLFPSVPLENFIGPYYMNQKVWKQDLDSTINITITKFFKIFTGFKYQHYSFKYNVLTYMPLFNNSFANEKTHIHYHGFGLGIGAAFNIHLVENLFLLWNASCFANMPYIIEKYSKQNCAIINQSSSNTYVIPFHKPIQKNILAGIGANTTLTLAYYIEKARITIGAGGRYQYLKILSKSSKKTQLVYKQKDDHFFGVHSYVVYSFNITKEKTEE